MSYIGQVCPDDLVRGREDVRALLTELAPGFRVLVNLSQLEAIDPKCAAGIGTLMELFDHRGVGMVARVIPDESKDIGFNILTVFHYPHPPPIVTCRNLPAAARALGL